MLPVILGASALILGGAYGYEQYKKKKAAGGVTQTQIAATLTPAQQAPPQFIDPSTGQPAPPTSNAANAMANVVQAQPPGQPPLPAAPPLAQAIQPGGTGIVNTASTNLTIRSQASTTATPVAGGDSTAGGGMPKGASVTITGPMTAGFYPVNYNGMAGFAWAAYIAAPGAVSGDATFYMGNFP